MPKSQFIDPKEVRKAGEVTFKPIPVNQYNKSLKEEKDNYTKEDLLRIYHDMQVIREFETMLNLIKTRGEYNEVPYNHPGPAHLSIGQEAAAVGMAYTLGVEDFIFGSHRSHGEILAKGLSAISKLSDEQLEKIMDSHFDGITAAPVKAGHTGTTKELAIKFLIYGTLAEVFARETGFNRGLGGSMHAFFTPFGVYPNNAIVGGCTSGRKEIIDMLRQRSRPYLFSNTLAPATVGATLKVIEMLSGSSDLPAKTMANAKRFRSKMEAAGFDLVKGDTAIVPVMLYDEPLAIKFADELLKEGVYVIGFCFPVVPRGKARIRVQLSAAHSFEQIDKAVDAFIKVGKKLEII